MFIFLKFNQLYIYLKDHLNTNEYVIEVIDEIGKETLRELLSKEIMDK